MPSHLVTQLILLNRIEDLIWGERNSLLVIIVLSLWEKVSYIYIYIQGDSPTSMNS